MICSSLSWTSLQASVVPDYSSRLFPTQARQSEFTNWLACSSARISFDGKLIAPGAAAHFAVRSRRLPEGQLCAAWEAAMDVRTEPFEVSFDRTASFRGRPGNRPFVLIGEKGLRRLQSFRQMLGAAMTRRGLRRLANTNFTPHVTLLYDARSVDEYPIEPICLDGDGVRAHPQLERPRTPRTMASVGMTGNWPELSRGSIPRRIISS